MSDHHPKRVLLGGIGSESHSFSRLHSGLKHFDISRGQALVEYGAGTRTTVGGACHVAGRRGWDLRPAFRAFATPSGVVEDEAFEGLLEELLRTVEAEHRRGLDGVLLPLHGAMLAQSHGDCEGEIIRRVREIVGADVPVAVALDLHGTLTEAMVEGADFLTCFRTTPHTDTFETGARTAEALQRMMTTGERPKRLLARGPVLMGLDCGRTLSGHGPMVRALASTARIEADISGVWDASVLAGFCWSDTAASGPSVLVVYDGPDAPVRDAAEAILKQVWDSRAEETIAYRDLGELLVSLAASPPSPGDGPRVICEYSDGIMACGYGDSTELLRAMLAQGMPGAVYSAMYDPEAAALAHAGGPGADLTLELGGKTDARFGGGPLQVKGRVLATTDGAFVRAGAFSQGSRGSVGRGALLDVEGIRVIVLPVRAQFDDPNQFALFGIDIRREALITLKSNNHFRAQFEPIASAIHYVDTGGLVSVDLKRFPFRNVRRPVWPLDDITDKDEPALRRLQVMPARAANVVAAS